MKSITMLKIALFSFICAIVFVVGWELTSIEILGIPVILSAAVCIISLIVWVCMKIFHHLRYSLNVIVIFVFLCAAVILGIITERTIGLANINNYKDMTITTIAFMAATFGCLVSILVLIGRRMFFDKKNDYE